MAKRLIKWIFNRSGLDVRRLPAYGTSTLTFLKEYNINSILDIGANSGQFAREVRHTLPRAYLYSFEPLREEYTVLVDSLGRHDERFRAFNVALGETDENKVMFRDDFTPSSSLLKPTEEQRRRFPHTGTLRDRLVPVRSLDRFIADNDIRLVPELFIKVDVQGYENRIIEGGLQTFDKAKLLMIEENYLHFYEGQPSFEDLFVLISRLGFVYKGSVNQSYDVTTGQPLFADGIFLKA